MILYNSARFNTVYTGNDTITSTNLISQLNNLAAHPDVKGVLIDLSDDFSLNTSYGIWDAQPRNPMAANYVASSIKMMLYAIAPSYPNWQYLVIVGDDRLIPFRRIRDEALFANERHYAPTAYTDILSSSLGLRYFLSDVYYAGLLPMPYKGRELYLPQLALGRLVEKPSEVPMLKAPAKPTA